MNRKGINDSVLLVIIFLILAGFIIFWLWVGGNKLLTDVLYEIIGGK
jgi:hypothetical protein